MDFEQFVPARDFFYLAALLVGAGIGSILNRFRRKTSFRFRNMCITIGLCFFSGAVAALTAAVIFSNWLIVKEFSLFLPAGILAVIIILAFRFPRAAGFPLILLAGVLVVFLGCTYLRIPVIEKDTPGLLLVAREESGLIHVRPLLPLSPKSNRPPEESVPAMSFQPAGDNPVLVFRSLFFSFSRNFPLIGGIHRGLITEILNNTTSLYSAPRFNSGFFPGSASDSGTGAYSVLPDFFVLKKSSLVMDLKEFTSGTVRTVLFDGSALGFR